MTIGRGRTATAGAERRRTGTHPPRRTCSRRTRATHTAVATRAATALLGAALLGGIVVACGGDGAARRNAERATVRSGALSVETTRRATVVGFANDTLSNTARIVALYPGTDADSGLIAVVFADSVERVSAGLAVLDLRAPDGEGTPHLAWPDSVHAVWWSAPHVLSFATTTGRGVTARVDLNADTLAVVLDSARRAAVLSTTPSPPLPPEAAAPRATAFVDSAHQQPAGRAAPHSALRYAVDSMVAAPSGRFVALHVTATDSSGRRRVNPAWYALALPSGAVASVDSVVGPATELPARAGAWGGPGGSTFYYARGKTVYGATVREGSASP